MPITILRKAGGKMDTTISREQELRNELVALCEADLAQREDKGPNRSEMIDAINKRLGVPLGSPYCIGGLLVRAVEVLCTRHDFVNPVVMTAGTQKFWRNAPEKFKKLKGNKAKKGDIGILVNKNDAAHGHAFMFREDETNVQLTIEYNTNGAGSRNGDGVYRLQRTAEGTISKTYRGSIDVVAWILSVNS
jgi:hypothetical protein